jgi:hypothetical protein
MKGAGLMGTHSENKNEQLFTNMAMTFSLEGVTKDIQEILQRKMNYHVKALKEISGIIGAIASSKDLKVRRKLIDEKSDISNLLRVTLDDYKIIVGSTTLMLKDLLKKKQFINDEILPTEEVKK